MAITDIKQIKKQSKTELRTNGKKCFFFTFIQQAYMLLGAFIFFHVEECYFKVQPTANKNNPCIQLCTGIHKLNQSGYLIYPMSINSSSTTTLNTSITSSTTNNESLETIFQGMMNNCRNEQCKETGETHLQKRCKIDQVGFVTWSIYTFTVVYTVGKC